MRGSQAIKDEGSKSKPSELSKMRGERVLMRDTQATKDERSKSKSSESSTIRGESINTNEVWTEGPRGKNMRKV